MQPIAFYLGSLPIHSYGVMIALAFLAGLWTATRRGATVGLAREDIGDITLWIMVGAIIGARVVYVITYWQDEFVGGPITEIFMIQHGGLVYYGGLIGASFAGALAIRWKKLPLWKTADVLAPSIALGSVFGRIGCLLNGCCYGRACSLPWAIRFPADHTTGGEPVHPTQLYDAGLNLLLYGFLAWLFRHKKFDGQVFATYLLCYALTRSTVELFRGDYNAGHQHFGLTPAQLVSVPIFFIGLALAAILSRRTPAK